MSHTTLHRIERGEHHITMDKLERILSRLKLNLGGIFPEEYEPLVESCEMVGGRRIVGTLEASCPVG